MKKRKPDWKQSLLLLITFILFLLLFHHWDRIKAILAAIFS